MTMSIREKNDWEGPFIARVQVYDTTHGDTVQYRCKLENSKLQFYAPKPLLAEMFDSEPQETLIVQIAKTPLPMIETGFRANNIPPTAGPDFLEYQFTDWRDQPVNSWLYENNSYGRRNSIYVPREVMGDKTPPNRIIVYLDIPEE